MTALEDVAFDGWSWEIIEAAAEKAEHDRDMATAVFPNKLKDVLIHFSDWADRDMLKRLEGIDPSSMRVRDRVRLAVQTRFYALKDYKEAVRHSTGYWLRPFRKYEAGKMVWQTADKIWEWAGDTSTDYNKYTKRGLLSGVLTSTTFAWMNDETEDQSKTLRFLDSRIDNVMQLGKVIGRVKSMTGRLKQKTS
ncbi:MAG: COQ9 family protein [Pseudomonadota bacterium]